MTFPDVTVESNSPVNAVKKLLAEHNLKGTVAKAENKSNCTVVSTGQKKTVTSVAVTDVVSVTAKKNAWCLLTSVVAIEENKYKIIQKVYEGSVQDLLAEAKLIGKTAYSQLRFYGDLCYSITIEAQTMRVKNKIVSFYCKEYEGAFTSTVYDVYSESIVATKGSTEQCKYIRSIWGDSQGAEMCVKQYIQESKDRLKKEVGKSFFMLENPNKPYFNAILPKTDWKAVETGYVTNKMRTGGFAAYVVKHTKQEISTVREYILKYNAMLSK